MKRNIKTVNDMNGLIEYFVSTLNWKIDLDYFEDIEDITYDFDAEDIGLKEEAFAKIKTLRQLRPLVDGQRWGIFCVEFDSRKFEITALRKILSGLIPTRRNSAEHAVWDQKDLLFICFWGEGDNRTIGIAHFEDKETGLPQIKMIYCAPAVEDFTQIRIFEDRLKSLKWPEEFVDHERWQAEWSSAFKIAYRQTISDVSTLTEQLAVEAQGIRNRILSILNVETRNGYVHLLYDKFKDTLIHDMTEIQFADMYAQTVVYGLFSARCMDETQEDFSAEEAVECIPCTNPFLKSLMRECLGSQNSMLSFDELEIGNVVDLLLHTKTDAIIQDFNRQTGGGREDPVIHFYEEFLEAYDKTQKVQRGVYYTPQPVVNFIVRAVDTIIKSEFGFEDGLASTETKKLTYYRESKKKKDGRYTLVKDIKDVPAIQVLDPAVGTGTFIRQSILQIYNNFRDKNKDLKNEELKRAWNDYVPKHLLPRLNAFELMMAPYAVAHMKLAMVLKDTGYDFDSDERLNVYLTNTLEEPGNSDMQISMFDDPLASESVAANVIKKNNGVNVVLGNPPYSISSSNKGEWILNLLQIYKTGLNEKKINLDDDYIKFIRFGENTISIAGYGILAFITNNSFLDGITHRNMRKTLMDSFDKIYIFNLHGNSIRKEKSPDGGKDENVFDIRQGVSINLFIKDEKTNDNETVIKYADLYGTRDHKFSVLNNSALDDIEWVTIVPTEPNYFYVNKSFDNSEKYNQFYSLKDLFQLSNAGIKTDRDTLFIDTDRERLSKRIKKLLSGAYDKGFVEEYKVKDSGSYKITKKIKDRQFDDSYICPIHYRPFDIRWIYYDPAIISRPAYPVMKELLPGDNLSLSLKRQSKFAFTYAFIHKEICESCLFESAFANNTEFPLYIHNEMFGEEELVPNINGAFITEVENVLGVPFEHKTEREDKEAFNPIDILDYVYAILYSETYRRKYEEFLKIDFPKIPIPDCKETFWEIRKFGEELRLLHTGGFSKVEEDKGNLRCQFKGEVGVEIKQHKWVDGKVFINKSSWFSDVPEDIWNYSIGGYMIIDKYLKDRMREPITSEQVQHIIRLVGLIQKTKEICERIDTSEDLNNLL